MEKIAQLCRSGREAREPMKSAMEALTWAERCTNRGIYRKDDGWMGGHVEIMVQLSGDDGGVSGLFSSGGSSVRFLARYDGEFSEPLVGRQGCRVSMRMARGSGSLLSSHSRGI